MKWVCMFYACTKIFKTINSTQESVYIFYNNYTEEYFRINSESENKINFLFLSQVQKVLILNVILLFIFVV